MEQPAPEHPKGAINAEDKHTCAAIEKANTGCRANPEARTVFVEEGGIETTGETPSFMYRYSLVLFVMNYAGSIDDFTLPLMAWLWFNQPDLLLNPDKTSRSNSPR